jgi:hypothetical protein
MVTKTMVTETMVIGRWVARGGLGGMVSAWRVQRQDVRPAERAKTESGDVKKVPHGG